MEKSTTPEGASILVTCPEPNCACYVSQCDMIVICYHIILAESLCTPSPGTGSGCRFSSCFSAGYG